MLGKRQAGNWLGSNLMATLQDAYKVMIRDSVSPTLRSLGFRGSAGSYEFPHPDYWVLLAFQKSVANRANFVKFTINTCIVRKSVWNAARRWRSQLPSRPSAGVWYGDFTWQRRSGHLLGKGDMWWTIESKWQLRRVERQVLAAIERVVVPAMHDQLAAQSALDERNLASPKFHGSS